MNNHDKIKMNVNWRIKKMNKRYGLLIVSVTILVLCFVGTASATNWSVDSRGGADFTGIQEAINSASDGDTILVYSGIYYENVVVDKSITLKGNGQPVVDANGSGSAITLTEDMITLVGFNAKNSGSSGPDVGIKVTSNNNTITGNNVCNNSVGIDLFHSCNNRITGNVFVNDGLSVSYSYKNTVEENTVNGKPLVYLEDVSDCKVEDAGQVIIVNCNNITIENLDLSNTSGGIALWKTENSKISNNTICSKNRGGISLSYSSNNNSITGNNVSNNKEEGISLEYSSSNKIYFNNFIKNTDNVDSSKSTNIWNSPLEITYTYDGTTYKSYLGNYWDDYEGTDAEGDGIGDASYSLKGDKDDYPLMKPFENYIT
jgi:parallel beta-helix repeat protein